MLKTNTKQAFKFLRCLHKEKFVQINFDEEIPMRIDNFLIQHFEKKFSFTFFQKIIRKKEIRVNEKKIKDANYRLTTNDQILIPKFLLEKQIEIKPKKSQQKQKVDLTEEQVEIIKSWVLYMNDEVIVINKPSGISVQGGNSNEKFNIDAMLDALKFDYKETPKLVHRIDKNVSGNLVIARNRKGAIRMFEWFKDRDVLKKMYWALIVGKPQPTFGRIKMRLEKKDKMYPIVDQTSKEGQLSITEYKILDSSQKVSLAQLYPITGRKHQLRVHCASGLGCEIIGDLKYGTGFYEFMPEFDEWENVFLHSREVSLPYIENNKRVVVIAPLFDHFSKMMKKFGFNEKYYKQALQ